MMTIFTIPKPFKGHIGFIQNNAVQSWKKLTPSCEIILAGDDFGVKDFADKNKLIHLSKIKVNKYGTPLLDDVFTRVVKKAKFPLVCYVNTDIIIPGNFLKAILKIKLPQYLAVGQRYDLDTATGARKIHPPSGSDYFVFLKNSLLWKIPPFAVGRPGWDNWMIYNARENNIPVIDLSFMVKVAHQNHDYSHVPFSRSPDRWEGPEADINRALIGDPKKIYDLRHTTHVATPLGVFPKIRFL